jgi:hypothetical protein
MFVTIEGAPLVGNTWSWRSLYTTAAPMARPFLGVSLNPSACGRIARLRADSCNEYPWCMDTENKSNATGPKVMKLPAIEMYAVVGLELGKTILEKLGEVSERIAKIEASVDTLARQNECDLSGKRTGE